jgi:hypothetical protein
MAPLAVAIIVACSVARPVTQPVTQTPSVPYDGAMADAAQVAATKKIYDKFGSWLERYSAGLPPGVMAAFMNHESGGRWDSAGDPTLGEVGYFQIAQDVPARFGLPAAARTVPEVNVAIAGLEYAQEAVLWYLRWPTLVTLGSADNWMLARLAFAIGRAGSYKMGDLARAAGYVQPGAVYAGIVRYVAANGAPSLGSQSSTKVASRVRSVPELWAVGQAVAPASPTVPTRPPQPPGFTYTLPASIARHVAKPIPLLAAAIAAGAGVAYYLWRRV